MNTHNKIHLVITSLFVFGTNLFTSAQNPIPAKTSQEKTILFTDAVLHNGKETYESGILGIAGGKVVLSGDAKLIRPDEAAFDTVISLNGKHIYPGLIAMNTTIGLNEIEQVRATHDYAETGVFNTSSRALIAYNTDSRVTPTVRFNGVMLAQSTPQGGRISGMSSVFKLDGWNWEDAVYKSDDGVHVNWPSQVVKRTSNKEDQTKQIEKNLQELEKLKSFIAEAKAYSQLQQPALINLQFEAMKDVFIGNRRLYVHTNHVLDIASSINFFKENGIKIVLVGGQDAWRLTSLLKQDSIPVVLTNIHRLPMREDDDIYLPYKIPAILKNAGVEFAISCEGFWQVRNLAFHAGTAVAFGLSYDDAIAAITSMPAKLLGIDKTTGTLLPGMDATLIISKGDLLDMGSSKIEHAFIEGSEIDLDNIQLKLYNKYMDKYQLNQQ